MEVKKKPYLLTKGFLGEENGMKWWFNILCLSGAILGIVAIFLPWMVYHSDSPDLSYVDSRGFSLLELMQMGTPGILHGFIVFGIVLIGGSIIAFFSGIGGFVQLIGVIFLFKEIAYYPLSIAVPPDIDVIAGLGAYIGLLASLITITSILMPIQIGTLPREKSIKNRIFAWNHQ